MSESIVNFICNRPWLSVFGSILLLIVLGSGLTVLKADFSHRGFFEAQDPLILQYNEFEKQFGNDDTLAIVVHNPDGIFRRESVELLVDFTDKVWTAKHIQRVDSLANFNWTHSQNDELVVEPFFSTDQRWTPTFLAKRKEIALSDPVLPNYLISKDARSAMILRVSRERVSREQIHVKRFK